VTGRSPPLAVAGVMFSGLANRGTQVLHQENQMERVRGRRVECVVDALVERGRLWCLGMDQEGSHSDPLCDGGGL
jgi:hypothetical protein